MQFFQPSRRQSLSKLAHRQTSLRAVARCPCGESVISLAASGLVNQQGIGIWPTKDEAIWIYVLQAGIELIDKDIYERLRHPEFKAHCCNFQSRDTPTFCSMDCHHRDHQQRHKPAEVCCENLLTMESDDYMPAS